MSNAVSGVFLLAYFDAADLINAENKIVRFMNPLPQGLCLSFMSHAKYLPMFVGIELNYMPLLLCSCVYVGIR